MLRLGAVERRESLEDAVEGALGGGFVAIEQSQFDRTLTAIEARLQGVEARTPEVESY